MSFSALDSTVTGPLFATPAMAGVFSDRARIAAMLRMEAALARAQGLAELAAAIDAIALDDFDMNALGRETAVAGVPVIPFVKAVQARLPGELERAFHRGATTQDVADTALVLQMRDAFDLIRADLLAISTA
jgi:3-carboxy-cis,cis-muconate cycloisomerase